MKWAKLAWKEISQVANRMVAVMTMFQIVAKVESGITGVLTHRAFNLGIGERERERERRKMVVLHCWECTCTFHTPFSNSLVHAFSCLFIWV